MKAPISILRPEKPSALLNFYGNFAFKNARAKRGFESRCRTLSKGTATRMMNITYRITEEIYSLGIDSRMSYGIAAYVNAEEEGTATVVSSIHDITADKQALGRARCPVQSLGVIFDPLNDVIEDLFAG